MVGELQTAILPLEGPGCKGWSRMEGYVSTKNEHDPSVSMSVPIHDCTIRLQANAIAGLSVHVFSHLLRHSIVPPV